MGAAFAAHNELGRLFKESHYARHMASRLSELGHDVEYEYKISLTHEDFTKDYYVDLLIDRFVPYELKTVKELSTEHEAQTLNYLYLCDVRHGKLINFQKPSVESRFISTSLNYEQRLGFSFEQFDWLETSKRPIKATLKELLDDWGAYLSLEAYKEALVYFCCAPDLRDKPLSFKTNSGYSGDVRLNRIDDESFLYLTTRSKYLNDHEKHLSTLLKMTGQRCAQWIHFDRNRVILRSIRFPI